ncbi:MAG: ABC transporter ATP-binding protein [Gammaproteobacteria bacterium]
MEIGIQDASVELGTRMVLEEVTLCFRKRAITGVLGPNGAGKSTLLRALAGIVPLTSGSVRLGTRDLIAMSRKEVARCVAYLSQNIEIPFPFPAAEVVMMGRYAHLSRFRSETEADHQAVARALLAVDAESLRMRPVDELSGGERQRILLARTLATEAPVLLLDEPIANLDIRHCLELLEILRDQATQGRTVLVAIHDLNFAHRFCERFVLLHGGRVLAQGTAEEVLVPQLLREAFEVKANHVQDPAGRSFFFFTRKNCDERGVLCQDRGV